MRVLHVGKFFAPFVGGIENFMLDLLRACHAGGVAQACLVHEAPGQRDDGGGDFEFLERFQRVPTLGQISYAPLSPGFARAMERMLGEFRPDVLHLHVPNTSAFWALKSRRARAIPWVVHWHSDVVGPGLDAKLKLLYPFYRPFERALLKRAAAVIATSPPYLESSRALRPVRDKCRVIPLGLDPARVEVSRGCEAYAWRDSENLKVLAVGRLSRYKGFEVLLRAAARVPEVEVVVAGEGQQRRRLERLLHREFGDEAGKRLRLIGSVNDAGRNRLMAGCDVFCLPSVNRGEAFGLSLVEAMAAGKPQIATRVPGAGMEWVVEEGRTGWMVASGEVGELAALLGRLARQRSILREAGRQSRQRFEQRFRIDAVARQMVKVYKSVLP